MSTQKEYAEVSLEFAIRGLNFAQVSRLNLARFEQIQSQDEFDGSLEKFLLNSVVLFNKVQAAQDVNDPSEPELTLNTASVSKITEADIASMSQPDAMTFMEVLVSVLSPDASEIKSLCSDIEGDGFTRPVYVPLHYPIEFGESKITGFELSAQNFGQLRELFRASGISTLSRDMLRKIAKPVGATIPLSDSVLDRIDYIDFLRIRDGALGKLQGIGRKRWSKL